jgi:exonuclease III
MLLNSYAPCPKTEAESKKTNRWRDETRARWDLETKRFAGEVNTPLVWLGDFNVGLDSSDKRPRDIRPHPDANYRRPGNRIKVQLKTEFTQLLQAGSGLVDAFLHLHPEVRGEPPLPLDVVEQRGTFYDNRGGCRIDYTLVSTSLRSRVARAIVLGHARFDETEDGSRNYKMTLVGFYGSDHCPIRLELSEEADGAAAEGEAAEAAGGHGEAEDGAAAAPEEYNSDADDELRLLRENTP